MPGKVEGARRATAADVEAISVALTAAFEADPVLAYFFPRDMDRRLARLQGYFRLNLAKLSLRHGHVYTTTEGVHGAAIWLPPGAWKTTVTDIVRTLPTTVRLLGRRLPFALRGITALEKNHPEQPAFYARRVQSQEEHLDDLPLDRLQHASERDASCRLVVGRRRRGRPRRARPLGLPLTRRPCGQPRPQRTSTS